MPKINVKRMKVRKKNNEWEAVPGFGEGVYPVDKTAAMTQPVGRDAQGRLFTAPTGGGGGTVDVDPTLTQEGMAADAKAVGDAIGDRLTAPTSGSVGDVLTVSAVDGEGKAIAVKTQKGVLVDGQELSEQEKAQVRDNIGAAATSPHASEGYAKTKVLFDRIPTAYATPMNYQGWAANSIIKYKGEYVLIAYLRASHTSSSKNTVCVFFKGYDIDRIEQCYFDGVAGYTSNIGLLSVVEYNGKYYSSKYTTYNMYESTDLINWTTSDTAVAPLKYVWGLYNIGGKLYATTDSDGEGPNSIFTSDDGGATWAQTELTTTYSLTEGGFVAVDDKILCFFGKNWTTSSRSAESGRAELTVWNGTSWGDFITTNIICNYGNVQGWFDGELVHIIAKSRRYHLENGTTGDASILRHYCATPAEAVAGTFTFVQRIDRAEWAVAESDGFQEGCKALDSTSVSLYMSDNGSGIVVSPVAVENGIMQHTFYSINCHISTDLSAAHKMEAEKYRAHYMLNKGTGSTGAKLKFSANVDDTTLNVYGTAGIDYASSATISKNSNNIITTSNNFSTLGGIGDGMVYLKPPWAEFAPILWGYKDAKHGYLWCRTAGWSVSMYGVWLACTRSALHEEIYFIVEGGKPMLYIDTVWGMAKVVPYTWKSVSMSGAKATSSPCISAQNNATLLKAVEYYGIGGASINYDKRFSEIDAALGSYITDVAELIGGDA